MFTIPTSVRKNGCIFYREKRSQKSTEKNLRFSQETLWHSNTNSINDCNTSLAKDAIHRVSTNGLFVAFFFQIGIKHDTI
ncbi:MAG: hypothetical protein V7K53_00075 [Nostoc sp.]|uniref:hypothetical protein n=1 Tax=Nostoc sp. TaxID=1180 RepID=UPI002FF5E8A8